MAHFADRLLHAIRAKGAPVCAGIDPRPELIPQEFYDRANAELGPGADAVRAAVRAFCLEVINLVEPYVPAVKPQVAFFEALGPAGMLDYAAVCEHAKSRGLLVIADVKRGDIGSTAEAYAHALFGSHEVKGIEITGLRVDCATVNPYLGGDSLEPLISQARKHSAGLFVLARTSNPGSAEFQQLALKDGGTVVEHLARAIDRWGADCIGECGYSDVGAVVGATHPASAARLRELMPKAIFLVPGWGAQGGDSGAVRACFRDGRGAIVNSSRGVTHAYALGPLAHFGESRWREAVETAAKALRDEVSALVK